MVPATFCDRNTRGTLNRAAPIPRSNFFPQRPNRRLEDLDGKPAHLLVGQAFQPDLLRMNERVRLESLTYECTGCLAECRIVLFL